MSPFHLGFLAKFIDYWTSCISEQVFSIHQVSQPDCRTAGRATEIVELSSFQSKEQSGLRQLVPCTVYICKIQSIKNSQSVEDWLRMKQQRAPFILGTEDTMISNHICIMIQKVLAQGLPRCLTPWSLQPHTFQLLSLPRHIPTRMHQDYEDNFPCATKQTWEEPDNTAKGCIHTKDSAVKAVWGSA